MPRWTDEQLCVQVGDRFECTMHARPWGYVWQVTVADGQTVVLVSPDGREHTFEPARFEVNLRAGVWRRWVDVGGRHDDA